MNEKTRNKATYSQRVHNATRGQSCFNVATHNVLTLYNVSKHKPTLVNRLVTCTMLKHKNRFVHVCPYCSKVYITTTERKVYCSANCRRYDSRFKDYEHSLKIAREYQKKHRNMNTIRHYHSRNIVIDKCFICGAKAEQRHHFTYSKEIEPKGVCKKCHKAIHKHRNLNDISANNGFKQRLRT